MNPASLKKLAPAAPDPEPIYGTMKQTAALVGLSTKALGMRLSRSTLPAGIIVRWGKSVMIHRERFLRWLESGAAGEEEGQR